MNIIFSSRGNEPNYKSIDLSIKSICEGVKSELIYSEGIDGSYRLTRYVHISKKGNISFFENCKKNAVYIKIDLIFNTECKEISQRPLDVFFDDFEIYKKSLSKKQNSTYELFKKTLMNLRDTVPRGDGSAIFNYFNKSEFSTEKL